MINTRKNKPVRITKYCFSPISAKLRHSQPESGCEWKQGSVQKRKACQTGQCFPFSCLSAKMIPGRNHPAVLESLEEKLRTQKKRQINTHLNYSIFLPIQSIQKIRNALVFCRMIVYNMERFQPHATTCKERTEWKMLNRQKMF